MLLFKCIKNPDVLPVTCGSIALQIVHDDVSFGYCFADELFVVDVDSSYWLHLSQGVHPISAMILTDKSENGQIIVFLSGLE